MTHCETACGPVGSVMLIFRGVKGILKIEEDAVAYIVAAMGLIAWVPLIMLGLAPAIG